MQPIFILNVYFMIADLESLRKHRAIQPLNLSLLCDTMKVVYMLTNGKKIDSMCTYYEA